VLSITQEGFLSLSPRRRLEFSHPAEMVYRFLEPGAPDELRKIAVDILLSEARIGCQMQCWSSKEGFVVMKKGVDLGLLEYQLWRNDPKKDRVFWSRTWRSLDAKIRRLSKLGFVAVGLSALQVFLDRRRGGRVRLIPDSQDLYFYGEPLEQTWRSWAKDKLISWFRRTSPEGEKPDCTGLVAAFRVINLTQLWMDLDLLDGQPVFGKTHFRIKRYCKDRLLDLIKEDIATAPVIETLEAFPKLQAALAEVFPDFEAKIQEWQKDLAGTQNSPKKKQRRHCQHLPKPPYLARFGKIAAQCPPPKDAKHLDYERALEQASEETDEVLTDE
jgi:hypothetical protein